MKARAPLPWQFQLTPSLECQMFRLKGVASCRGFSSGSKQCCMASSSFSLRVPANADVWLSHQPVQKESLLLLSLHVLSQRVAHAEALRLELETYEDRA